MMQAGETYAEVRRRLAAAPERVFAAFADADLVRRWLRPAPDIALDVLEFDFREGGGYRFAYAVPSGATVIVSGTYRSIVPPSRIVFSWMIAPPDEHAGIPSEVTILIGADGEGSELVIRHDRLERVDAVARHREGWRHAAEQLSVLLAGRGA